MTVEACGNQFHIDKGSVRSFCKRTYNTTPSLLNQTQKKHLKQLITTLVECNVKKIKKDGERLQSNQISEVEQNISNFLQAVSCRQ